MYCNQCHNARALGERTFSNYQNVAAHMRVRANLTGKEYEKLLEFLRRWHDVPSPPPTDPSPKRLIYGQPVAELRDEIAPVDPAAAADLVTAPIPPAAGAGAAAPRSPLPARPAAPAAAQPAIVPAPPQPAPAGPRPSRVDEPGNFRP